MCRNQHSKEVWLVWVDPFIRRSPGAPLGVVPMDRQLASASWRITLRLLGGRRMREGRFGEYVSRSAAIMVGWCKVPLFDFSKVDLNPMGNQSTLGLSLPWQSNGSRG